MSAGAKIRIAGRLKLRIDYRVFLLGDPPDSARGSESIGTRSVRRRVSTSLSEAVRRLACPQDTVSAV